MFRQDQLVLPYAPWWLMDVVHPKNTLKRNCRIMTLHICNYLTHLAMVIHGSYTIKMNHDTNNINNKVGIATWINFHESRSQAKLCNYAIPTIVCMVGLVARIGLVYNNLPMWRFQKRSLVSSPNRPPIPIEKFISSSVFHYHTVISIHSLRLMMFHAKDGYFTVSQAEFLKSQHDHSDQNDIHKFNMKVGSLPYTSRYPSTRI